MVALPAGSAVHAVVTSRDPAQRNSAVEVYWQLGLDTPRGDVSGEGAAAMVHTRVLTDLLEQVRHSMMSSVFLIARCNSRRPCLSRCVIVWAIIGFPIRVLSRGG
jgi:hypothetical protein